MILYVILIGMVLIPFLPLGIWIGWEYFHGGFHDHCLTFSDVLILVGLFFVVREALERRP